MMTKEDQDIILAAEPIDLSGLTPPEETDGECCCCGDTPVVYEGLEWNPGDFCWKCAAELVRPLIADLLATRLRLACAVKCAESREILLQHYADGITCVDTIKARNDAWRLYNVATGDPK